MCYIYSVPKRHSTASDKSLITILGQRIRLDLNNVQTTFFERCAGTSRFVYNWGLDRWKAQYEAGGKPSWVSLSSELNACKTTEFPWMIKLPWAVPSTALSNLGNAFSNFFRRVKSGQKPGYPRFKSKKRNKAAFAIEGRALRFDGRRVKIPKLGWVRARQEIRFPGKILSAHFTKHAGHWYVSIQVQVSDSWSYPHRCETQEAVGVDLGLRDLAVLSTGERVEAPRILRAHETRLRRLNKEMSRRVIGGRNWQKTKTKLSRLHERISNIRKDVTHKLTARLVRDFRRIGIEDLNVKGMMANHHLAKSIADAALSEIRRQLMYKAPLAGSEIIVADLWFPSSKLCSDCGTRREGPLPLSIREWVCEACGVVHDRDINAAINLRTAALAGIACCQESSGSGLTAKTKLSLGQESSGCVN